MYSRTTIGIARAIAQSSHCGDDDLRWQVLADSLIEDGYGDHRSVRECREGSLAGRGRVLRCILAGDAPGTEYDVYTRSTSGSTIRSRGDIIDGDDRGRMAIVTSTWMDTDFGGWPCPMAAWTYLE